MIILTLCINYLDANWIDILMFSVSSIMFLSGIIVLATNKDTLKIIEHGTNKTYSCISEVSATNSNFATALIIMSLIYFIYRIYQIYKERKENRQVSDTATV